MIMHNKKFAISSSLSIFLIISLIIILKLFYIYYVYPNESYRGYNYINHGFFLEASSVLFGLLPLFILKIKPKKPSEYGLNILFLFVFIPSISVGSYLLNNSLEIIIFFLTNLLGVFCLWLSSNFFSKYFLIRKIINFPNQFDYFFLISFIYLLSIFSLISLIQNFDYIFSIQSMEDIYSLRLENRSNSGGISGYIYAALRSLVLIFFIYKFFQSENNLFKFLFLCVIFCICLDQLLSVFIRSHLYILLMLMTVGYFLNRNTIKFYHFPMAAIIFSLTCFFVDYIFNIDFLSYTFVRRLLIVPGSINAFYFSYVNDIGTFFELEKASNFFNFDNVTYTIGSYSDQGNFNMNMNTNLWSISYAYIGIVGIIATSLVSGIILSFLNLANNNKSHFLGAIIAVYFGLIWSEQSLWSSFLSNGIIYCIFFFVAFSSSNSTNWKKL